MESSLQTEVENLTDHQVGQVFEGLVEELQKEIERLYLKDEEALAQLRERGQASSLLIEAFSVDVSERLSLDPTSLRQRLLRIAEEQEFQPNLRKALEHRFFASGAPVDPMTLKTKLWLLQ